jgi:hypothetical protein
LSSLASVVLLCAGAVAALGACGTSQATDDCSAVVDRACATAYEPTFDNVFQRTLRPSCALAGASCHASEGHQAGLVFEDPDVAHRLLLERPVVAGKPECSLLVRRVTSTDTSFMMPPGLPLTVGEQCAIAAWIDRGAAR